MIYCDIDGVMFDTFPCALAALNRALKAFQSWSIDAKTFNEVFWGHTWGEARAWLEKERGICQDELDELKRQKDKYLAETIPSPSEAASRFLCSMSHWPRTFCTASSTAGLKVPRLTKSLSLIPVLVTPHKMSPEFWGSNLPRASLVIDDDIRVIGAAEAVKIPTIHWRQYLRRFP
jgi:beta-phosphoglucomutase-like phosphatase (HAD superfamily)